MARGRRGESWLRLALIPELTPARVRCLLAAFPDADSILGASTASLRGIVPEDVIEHIRAGPDATLLDRTEDWLQGPGHRFLTLGADDYPRYLREIADAPPFLYLNGDAELLHKPALAVVGSRHPTAQGKENAYAFAKALSDGGLVIVSGLALGVDACAHAGGLDGVSRSIAVIGTGMDLVYPARNRDLAHRIASEGLLVSEFPLGTPALGRNFPRRNRIISGLSVGCLVVEAAPQSGSLITARLAGEQGRDVFAIPGSIHSPLSKGCHALIKQGAKLVENARDVMEELGVERPARKEEAAQEKEKVNDVLKELGFDPVTVDALAQRTALRTEDLLGQILELELNGQIARLPGGRIQRIR
jgi:DNA processing protein